MTILGESQTGTIINGENVNWIFQINSGLNVTIQNLTITNASGQSAIFNQGNLTVENCKFSNNYEINNPSPSYQGGSSICNYANSNSITVAIANCTFTGNSGDRGAIFNFCDGEFSIICAITNCNFIDNHAPTAHGGAIGNYANTGYVNCTIDNCTFTNNTANMFGGAIINYNNNGAGVNCTINSSSFINNHANNNGGAITNFSRGSSSNSIITGCNFIKNTAGNGGSIENYMGTTLIAHFNRFYNNTATNGNVINREGGSVDAENNWWGTNDPNLNWSNYISGFNANPVWWIYMNLTANPANPLYNDQINLVANFNYHSNGTDITPLTGGHIPDSEVIFASNDGSLNPSSKNTMNGLASSIFTPTTSGSVTVNATLDNQICSLTFNVKGISSVSVDSVHNFAGQTVNLTATIVDQNGKPIQYGLVTFKVGAYTSLPVTISNGKAIYTWQIPANWNVGNYTILANYTENSDYIASSGIGNLTVTKTPTNLTTSNITGNKGKTITLNAALTDYYGTPLNNKIIEFYINNIKVGQNSTNSKGIATFNYNITQIGGIYNITVKFLGDSRYLASISNGTLKVNQSSVYVNVTASKTNPTVGETIILTFKLGNNGPDPADDVVFTYVIPEGMEFVSIDTEPGYQQATYNPTTRTITWPLGTVPILDPWIKLNVRILNSGAFNINPTVTTSTYDPTLGNNIQQITINAVQTTSATSTIRTIGMQKTGLPIAGLILAILAVLGGLITPKRK